MRSRCGWERVLWLSSSSSLRARTTVGSVEVARRSGWSYDSDIDPIARAPLICRRYVELLRMCTITHRLKAPSRCRSIAPDFRGKRKKHNFYWKKLVRFCVAERVVPQGCGWCNSSSSLNHRHSIFASGTQLDIDERIEPIPAKTMSLIYNRTVASTLTILPGAEAHKIISPPTSRLLVDSTGRSATGGGGNRPLSPGFHPCVFQRADQFVQVVDYTRAPPSPPGGS